LVDLFEYTQGILHLYSFLRFLDEIKEFLDPWRWDR